MAGSTHPDTRAMALAVSASGIVAGAWQGRCEGQLHQRQPDRFPPSPLKHISDACKAHKLAARTSYKAVSKARREEDGFRQHV